MLIVRYNLSRRRPPTLVANEDEHIEIQMPVRSRKVIITSNIGGFLQGVKKTEGYICEVTQM